MENDASPKPSAKSDGEPLPASGGGGNRPPATHVACAAPADDGDEMGEGQMSLLTPEEESALFLPVEELRKRYTGAQAEKMEWRRNACVRMLAYGIPAEYIARDLHMNLRTVSALAAQYGKTIASFSEKFAQNLMESAAADIAAAETKRGGASHKDLHIAAGIKMQHAMAVKLVADTGPTPLDITSENERTAAIRAKLKALKPAAEEKS